MSNWGTTACCTTNLRGCDGAVIAVVSVVADRRPLLLQ